MPEARKRRPRMMPTARPALAPGERVGEEEEEGGSVVVGDGVGDEEVDDGVPVDVMLLLLLVGVDVLVELELLLDSSFPTAGGPLVLPFKAWAACLMLSAVVPESPEILKRSE